MHPQVDVLIVGAGISGIAAGYYLQQRCPTLSWQIIEARDSIGGTWDLFRYPGIRSDSDMYTLGYRFRPWRGEKAIVGGADILQYVKDTAREHGIDKRIHFGQRVKQISWSSSDSRWTAEVESADGARSQIRCKFLFMCTGYYRYDRGYRPEWPGMDDFAGQLVHPQGWRGDMDYAGKRIVVIGSGATAVTLVPALAEESGACDHAATVAQLHRQPTGPR